MKVYTLYIFVDIENMKVARPEMLYKKKLVSSKNTEGMCGQKRGSCMNTEITTSCENFSSFLIQKSTKKGS